MRTILSKLAALPARLMVLGLMVLVAGAACSSSLPGSGGRGAAGRIRVVAAENFWGSIAAQLAGADADVISIIHNPDTDPHAYEPTPADARAIASAQLVIENGIGYDSWAQQLVDAEHAANRAVLNVGRLVGVGSGGNPHQWYSYASVRKFVDRVTTELETVDPKHRTDYERNHDRYEAKGLAPYEVLIEKIRRTYANTPIGGSESVVAPLAETLGLKLTTPASFLQAVSEGNEPSASDKATVDAQIQQHQIAVFVYNSQNATPDVQRLVDAARRPHIPVATLTETLVPVDSTFQDWQVHELRGLLAALASGTGR